MLLHMPCKLDDIFMIPADHGAVEVPYICDASHSLNLTLQLMQHSGDSTAVTGYQLHQMQEHEGPQVCDDL